MIGYLSVGDENIIDVSCSSEVDLVTPVATTITGNIIKLSYGILYRMVMLDDNLVTTSITTVVNDPNTIIDDPHRVYRLTNGMVIPIVVSCRGERYMVDITDYEKYLAMDVPDDYWLATNKLTPHLVKIARVRH